MRILQHLLVLAGQCVFMFFGWFFLDLYEARQNFYREAHVFLEKASDEFNKNIWGIKLSLLEFGRSNGYKISPSEWECSGIEKIQPLESFQGIAKICNFKDEKEKSIKLDLGASDLNLPPMPENYTAYVLDLDGNEITSIGSSVRLYSQYVNLTEYSYKALVVPNLVLLFGKPSHSYILSFASKNSIKLILLLVLVSITNLIYFLKLRKKELLIENQTIDIRGLEKENDYLENSLLYNRKYYRNLEDRFSDFIKSINEISGIFLQGKKGETNLLLSPAQEISLITRINEITLTSFHCFSHMKPEQINLLEFFSEINLLLYDQLKKRSVNIILTGLPSSVAIKSNKLFLTAFMLRLLHNSIQNSAPNSMVNIQYSKVNGRQEGIQIEISDEAYEDFSRLYPALLTESKSYGLNVSHTYKGYEGNRIKVLFRSQEEASSINSSTSCKKKAGNVYQIYN